ncbi:MAG TPA: LLM class flavin-dependent oxidoreductase [Candidatus Cybelea sp.]|nr:LLM class flavin-dependent oxidoreductase [Candidatus Cybelea sp.]
MPLRIGYLLPTRERVMEGHPETAPLLALAARAEDLGYDSVWVGDSLLARPRHDPLTLLAAVAARTRRVELGTAVLLPALRNPVVLAQQVATLDQIAEGRVILGIGIASDVPNIRTEFVAAGVPFEKRVGRMLEGLQLCRALWTGKPVDWRGRWTVEGGVLGPTPHRPGGPPIWIGGTVHASLQRIASHFDGWFPNKPDAAWYAEQWAELHKLVRAAGRAPSAITGAAYLTLAIDDNEARAERRMNAFVENYYGQAADLMRSRQACFAGSAAGAAAWLRGYAKAGATHLVLRFAGDHDRQLETIAGMRREISA